MTEPIDTNPLRDAASGSQIAIDRMNRLARDLAANIPGPGVASYPIPAIPRDPSYDLLDLAEQGLASNICPQLIRQLNAFNRNLDAALEVGICIIGVAGQGITLHPTAIEPWDPSLVVIYGTTAGNSQPVQIIQHISQLSIALVTLPREDPGQPKRPIGFHSPNSERD